MPIKFKCPNPGCARGLTVRDEAAGRAGKCPSCGAALTVPPLTPAVPEEPDPYALLDTEDAAPEPEPDVVLTPVSRALPTLGGQLHDREVGAAKTAGAAVRFSAIGLGMTLLGQKLGTWVLATFVFFLSAGLLNVAITLVMLPVQFALRPVLGEQLAPLPVAFVQLVAQTAVYGLLMGGMARMALKQLDGRSFGIGDMYAVKDVAVTLMVLAVLVQLITIIGCVFLLIPGLIATGLLMFATPLVVDGGLGTVDALRVSFETLKRDWFKATLFVVVLAFITLAGVLPCYLGTLFTIPIAFLSTAAQYRRNFAPGAKPRALVVEDPWAEATGQPLSARRAPKMPGLAWFLFAVGLLVPVLVVIVTVALISMAVQGIPSQTRPPGEFVLRKGAAPPGMPPPGQLPSQDDMNRAFDELKAQMEASARPRTQTKAQVQAPNAPDAPPAPRTTPPAATPRDARRTQPATVAELAAALDGDARPARLRALSALAKADVDPTEQNAIADRLRKSLDDPDILVRAGAVKALAVWGDDEDTPRLVAALQDPQKTVNRAAVEALGHRKDPATLDAIFARASDQTLHSTILNAFKNWGPALEPELIDRLQNDDRDIRETACQSLRDNGTAASLTPLRNALNDKDPGVASQARRALQAVEGRVGVPKKPLVPRSKKAKR